MQHRVAAITVLALAALGLYPALRSAPEPAPSIVFEDAIQRSGITFKMNNSITPQ